MKKYIFATIGVVLSLSVAPARWGLAAGPDFNGDRYADIADQYKDPLAGAMPFWIRLNFGNGTFDPPGAPDWGSGSAAGPRSTWYTVVGDFSGDGLADFVDLIPSSGSVWMHRNLGNGGFDSTGTMNTAITVGRETLAGRVNGDVYEDLVVVDPSNGALKIWENILGSFFWSGPTTTFRAQVGSDWRTVMADFNGDGWADVADVHLPSAQFWVHVNTGTVDFNSAAWAPVAGVAAASISLIFADFTGDGYADFAEVNRTNGVFIVHENLRNQTFSAFPWNSNGQYTGATNWGVMGTPVVF